eukprot:359120-Chlamydomonas_euryale.AAC.3
MDAWLHGWMDGWMHKGTDRRTDGWISTSPSLCRPPAVFSHLGAFALRCMLVLPGGDELGVAARKGLPRAQQPSCTQIKQRVHLQKVVLRVWTQRGVWTALSVDPLHMGQTTRASPK